LGDTPHSCRYCFLLASLLLQSTIVLSWLALVGGLSEALRRLDYGPEITRKVVHIGAGQVILLAWWLQVPAWAGIGASVVFSLVALLSYRFPLLPGINSVGRKSLGTFFYALSIGLLVAWFWPLGLPQYAAIGILTMTWGDGLAALIGQRFGRHPYQIWGEKKSWEGSLAMLLVSYAVCAGILLAVQGPGLATWATAAVAAVVATGLESVSKYGLDNLSVPLGTAAVCFWLGTWV
jgi:phytol kinase